MSVAFAMPQRNVADCPRSMLRGSAVKLSIRAAPATGGGGVGVGVLSALGGGGGVDTGAFFGLHPAALISNNIVNTAALSVLGLILIWGFPFLRISLPASSTKGLYFIAADHTG
jgi:hypothetical protein